MTPRTQLLLVSIATIVAGCEPTLVGSSSLVTVTPEAGAFDRLELFHELKAVVVQGSERRVRITINDNLQEHLVIQTGGGRLRIGMEEGFDYDRLTAHAEVTVPVLTSVDLSGATSASLSGFEAVSVARFDASLSGASRLEGRITADRLALDLSGASRADLGGVVRELALEVSGASQAGLHGLEAQVAAIDLSGASRATVLVRGEVRGEASGASELVVHGGATTNVETSGASSVTHRGE
jgi:hypothetical protein